MHVNTTQAFKSLPLFHIFVYLIDALVTSLTCLVKDNRVEMHTKTSLFRCFCFALSCLAFVRFCLLISMLLIF